MESKKPPYEEAVQFIAEYIVSYMNQSNTPTLTEWFENDKLFFSRLITDVARMYDKKPHDFDQDLSNKLDEMGF